MSRAIRGAEATIDCKIFLGMFSSERGVVVELPDGRKVMAVVDKRYVFPDREPKPGTEVDGRVKVFIVESKKDTAIVDLPQAGLTQGPRLEIPRTFLR